MRCRPLPAFPLLLPLNENAPSSQTQPPPLFPVNNRFRDESSHSPLVAPRRRQGLLRRLVVRRPLVVLQRRQPEVARARARKLTYERERGMGVVGRSVGWLGG